MLSLKIIPWSSQAKICQKLALNTPHFAPTGAQQKAQSASIFEVSCVSDLLKPFYFFLPKLCENFWPGNLKRQGLLHAAFSVAHCWERQLKSLFRSSAIIHHALYSLNWSWRLHFTCSNTTVLCQPLLSFLNCVCWFLVGWGYLYLRSEK